MFAAPSYTFTFRQQTRGSEIGFITKVSLELVLHTYRRVLGAVKLGCEAEESVMVTWPLIKWRNFFRIEFLAPTRRSEKAIVVVFVLLFVRFKLV